MARIGIAVILTLATGCVGQLDPSSSSESSPDDAMDASPDGAMNECQPGTVQGCTQSSANPVTNGNVGTQACEVGDAGYVWGACTPATCSGASLDCTTYDGQAGVAQCYNGQSVSPCGLAGVCTPGAVSHVSWGDCTELEEDCVLEGGHWSWVSQPCWTPLVLAFDGAPVAFTAAAGEFDLAGQRASVSTRWVSARTPWLALDLDGNGRIDDGRELFGSMTPVGGRRAANGFDALAALDDDGDGRITARDAAFDRLLLWSDTNQDRRSQPSELQSAGAAGLLEIRLSYAIVRRCDDGDCEVERATFVFLDASGREREGDVIDVHLATR